MNVCFFGSYDRNYSRNKILIDGLKKNNVGIYHCNSSLGSFIFRYPYLLWQFLFIAKKIQVIFVAYRGHLDVPLAFVLAKVFRKKLVFDIYYSLFDTYVFDRRVLSRNSLSARFYFWLDKIDCLMPDLVITFSNAASNYFIKTFSVSKNKFYPIYIGGDDSIFKPIKKKRKDYIIVEMHAWFTRNIGAEYFIQAAKKLEYNPKIVFWLIGNTVNYDYPFKLLKKLKPKNLTYYNSMPIRKLAKLIAQADVSLSHIGKTNKASTSIGNKTYQGMAVRNAVIVPNYPATYEQLTNKKDCVIFKAGNTLDLIDKILLLANNRKLLDRIAHNAYKLHQAKFTNKKIGFKLKQEMLNVLN